MKNEVTKCENAILTVVIVNWNTKELLSKCLSSVEALDIPVTFNVTIVDNASNDGSVAFLNDVKFKHLVVFNDENLGFSKAINIALRESNPTPYYLLLNTDAEINTLAILEMLTVMDNNATLAGVNPALREPSGKLQYGGAGWGPSWMNSLNTMFFFYRFSKHFRGLFMIQDHYKCGKSIVYVDWLAFACTVLRKKAFDEVGMLSEKYFVYGEDSDWCWSARKQGWMFGYLPYVSVEHIVGASSKDKAQSNPKWFQNLAHSIENQGSTADYRLLLLFGMFGYLMRYYFYWFSDIGRPSESKKQMRKRSWWLFKICTKLLVKY